MDGVAAGLFGNGDDLLYVQVGGSPATFKRDSLIRLAGMQGTGIILGRPLPWVC